MSAAVSPIPPGYHRITPHIIVSDAKKAADFYQKAFGAEVRGMAYTPDGKVIHAEVKIGDSILMFNDEIQAYGVVAPTTTKASTCVTLHMYVEDADKVFASALAAGAKVVMPLQDQFWGDRYGTVEDPFGHRWSIATHIKDQSPEEMKAAMDEAMSKMAASHS
ncbi:MAG TPA: VOC family protein [Terriglobales bacterium]